MEHTQVPDQTRMCRKSAISVLCLRRGSFAEVATKAGSGFAQAGRHVATLTYPRVKRVSRSRHTCHSTLCTMIPILTLHTISVTLDNPMPKFSSPTFLTKHGYLLLLIPTIFVYVLATILFELGFTTKIVELPAAIGAQIASQDLSKLTFKLVEMKTRYIWFATTVVHLVITIYAAALCSIIIYRSHSGKRLVIIEAIGSVLIILGLASLIYSAMTRNAMFELIYNFSFSALTTTGLYQETFLSHVDRLLTLANTLAVIVPCMVLLAASSTLAPSLKPNHNDLAHLTTQMRHLKGVLNAGSALLVSGILHMSAWLRWPVGLLHDPTEQSALSGAVLSITMFWGATFTVMLITTYGPASSYLSSQARHIAEQAYHAGTIQDPQRWLHDNNFSKSLGEQLPQIGVILGPVLAGPIGSFLMSHVSS